MAKRDPNDVAAEVGPEGLRKVAQQHTRAAMEQEIGRPLRPSTLLAYDTENDINNLLGRRWICRGQSALWVGQSGIGKSSLTVQAAVTWALGEAFFGIMPVRALKSVIIQAENDVGDQAEQMKGVLNGLQWAGERQALDQQVLIWTENNRTGEAFVLWLRTLVRHHRPDLVWIDPLLAYVGDDISRADVAARFLRNWLNPIAEEFGCSFMLVHHTGKPPKDRRNAYHGHDLSYLGMGSSELTNWARAIAVLQVRGDQFELQLPKRGKRAGMLDRHGRETTTLALQHATASICWVPADEEAAEEIDPVALILAALDDTWRSKSSVVNRAAENCTRKQARSAMDEMEARYGLHDIEHGEIKTCSGFKVRREGPAKLFRAVSNDARE